MVLGRNRAKIINVFTCFDSLRSYVLDRDSSRSYWSLEGDKTPSFLWLDGTIAE